MASIDERARTYDLHAFVAPETINAIAERAAKLARTNRPCTVVRRSLTGATVDRTPEVIAGLHLDNQDGVEPVLIITDTASSYLRGIVVRLEHTHGWSIQCGTDFDEATQRRRFQADQPESVTFVEITGFGEGRSDQIRIVKYNEHGYGEETVLAFAENPSAHEQADAQANVLESLADVVPENAALSAETLRAVARHGRANWQLAPEAAKAILED